MTVDGGGVGPIRETARRSRRAARRRVSFVGVLGELFITAGVFVLLFLGWQLWLQDILVGAVQDHSAHQLNNDWQKETATTPTTAPVSTEPVIEKAPGNAEVFGILYVPRWGKDWERKIAQGIGVADVLDKIGVGHYPGTAMPGQVGNFAIAAHRHAYGGGFQFLHQLHVGDNVYIGTKAGWYEYTFRDIEYVQPTQVNVLQPVPMEPGVAPTNRILTMTTCNPFFSTAERMVGYSLFDKFYPRADGPPAEIAKTVKDKG